MDTMTPLSSFPEKLWTVDEVAAYLNCTTRHVHNLLRAGLPHLYLGRLLRFDPSESTAASGRPERCARARKIRSARLPPRCIYFFGDGRSSVAL
jgi:excisionase family DNA binding protein